MPAPDLRAKIRLWTDKYVWIKTGRGEGDPYIMTERAIDEAMDAIAALSNLPANTPMPSWINTKNTAGPAPDRILSFANMLLDLSDPKHPCTLKHTPKWFSLNTLPYDYDPKAKCPYWLKITKEWSKDKSGIPNTDWVLLLQEWFAYNLLPDTSRQKFMQYYGPRRAGKGTVLRIQQAMLGRNNCCSPTLSSLGGTFGYETAYGKLAMLVSDAHLGYGSDKIMVMEAIARIVGEDPIDINRKYKPPISVPKLATRITVAVNELLKFPDPTGKTAARMLMLHFANSYYGKEDAHLTQNLLAELPGICNWAIQALPSLQSPTFRFTEPASSKKLLQEFEELGSPFTSFVNHCCVYPDLGGKVPIRLFKTAASRHFFKLGKQEILPREFKEYMRTICPQVRPALKYWQGKLTRCFTGISLESVREDTDRKIDSLKAILSKEKSSAHKTKPKTS